jgi:hypothetical protein
MDQVDMDDDDHDLKDDISKDPFGAVTLLVHLYGYDIEQRPRGRILKVRSISVAVSGIASVVVYAATNSCENR